MSRKRRVLVVDDDALQRKNLQLRLRAMGYEVELAGDGGEAARLAAASRPDAVLTDVVMPELSGMELLRVLKRENPSLPVILMTSMGTIEMAVEAMIQGAHNFLTKPVDPKKLGSVIEAALRSANGAEGEVAANGIKASPEAAPGPGLECTSDRFGRFVGGSRAMREVYQMIRAVASKNVSVLITGESGTGKELVARTIHELSARAQQPFVPVNSAAIPNDLLESEIFGHEKGAFTGASDMRRGCFELADKGTLFLDELGEMPLSLQPKLLRVLEDGRVRRLGGSREFEFDVRVIAATNRPPREAIEQARLREDLYYRLNVFGLQLPALRDRLEDLPALVASFVENFNRKHQQEVKGVRAEAMDRLMRHSWPGNVRQLRNVIERAVILAVGNLIEPSQLPAEVLEDARSASTKMVIPDGVTAAEAERFLILQTLERTENNKAEAARRLGLDVKTIRNKLKTYEKS